MSTRDTVLVALGRGDRRLASRLAVTALLSAGPAMLALAILLAIGGQR